MVDTKASDCHTIGGFYNVNGKKLQRQYRNVLSDFRDWKEKPHAKKWLVFPQNIGPYLSIDETALTLDMANSMKTIAQKCFPKAMQVIDRFHVQKLVLEALQDIQIKHRWDAIDLENEQTKQARLKGKSFKPPELANGDTRKLLLARSRYLLYKAPNNWTGNQHTRARILFDEYPDIKTAFHLMQGFRNIFNTSTSIEVAYTKLAQWYNEVEKTGFKAFNTIVNTITINYRSILSYFINRSTNASAESFNAKIKAFRAQFRGVKNVEFFLFRLTTIFA